MTMNDYEIEELKKSAEQNGIIITCGIGLPPQYSTSSLEEKVRQNGLIFMKKLLDAMNKLNSKLIGGTVHSYWPADYSKPVRKQEEWEISIQSVKELADYAWQYNISLALESLNRFEQYLINDADEKKMDEDMMKSIVFLKSTLLG